MHLAFLGLGQIGGSVARAASIGGFASRITAWTPSGAGPRAAAGDGIEPMTSPEAAIRDADLIVLAAPPLGCLELIDALAGPLGSSIAPDAVITDVASTKVAIERRARGHGLRFIGGHPMAGREAVGYAAADPELFRGRPWVIAVPRDGDASSRGDADRVIALVEACRARPIQMSAEEHDAAVAGISHLPLVVSAALVETVTAAADWPIAGALAAGGWASMSRLARGAPTMGAGILATNAAATADRLRAFRRVIDDWLRVLDGGTVDQADIERRLAAISERLAADGGHGGVAGSDESGPTDRLVDRRS